MFFLLGGEALPAFRIQQLAAALSADAGRAVDLQIDEFFLLAADGLPDEPQRSHLLQLLRASEWADPTLSSHQLAVVPRPGTTSPWASRAADILRRCRLQDFSRIERGLLITLEGLAADQLSGSALERLHDRMTQIVVPGLDLLDGWFREPVATPLGIVELGDDACSALARVNGELGLALSEGEIDYLAEAYRTLERDPTDAELMMFAQANSEHCRHKIFNATWRVDGEPRDPSLFGLIRRTHAATPDGTLVAYDDNAAVLEGFDSRLLSAPTNAGPYGLNDIRLNIQIKVETHNHPTAISPQPGAATGAGGEIRDESAIGRGARPVAALTGFSVSDLHIPDLARPWENAPPAPKRLASSLEIMLEGPIGAARFNNEFGRPALLGYFRTFSSHIGGELWGYHKPIMIAGGSGMIAEGQTHKKPLSAGDRIIVLGGPAMLIGLGGGAASSMSSGQSSEELDFASVQRGNPEMQRRCQEVIDRCWSLGADNPVKSIHDVGAGGLSNAIPELLHDGGVGGRLDLREVPVADASMSPLAVWCNEAQERYVLAIAPEALDGFADLCRRERCPWADLGPATDDGRLVVDDRLAERAPIDMPLEVLLGRPPKMHRDAQTCPIEVGTDAWSDIALDAALDRVLALPAVGSKQFLITIADRTVGGLSVRDPMVGPHQVPVADCAISLLDYEGYAGTAMTMGERTPLAVWNAAAAARMAVGEALTNLAGCRVTGADRIKLSANWMAAAGSEGQDAALRAAVEAVSELCPALELAIPVGKDSLSMQTVWEDEDGGEKRMRAPVSLIVSAFAPVADVRRHVTPELHGERDSVLLLIGGGRTRLGGSALAQVFEREFGDVPDVDDPAMLAGLFASVQELLDEDRILACHDRSDGGLIVAVLEMALAGHCGVELVVPADIDPHAFLFNEELGLVIEVAANEADRIVTRLEMAGQVVTTVGRPREDARFRIRDEDGKELVAREMGELATRWGETSYRLQKLRDHPECADEAYQALSDWSRPGLSPAFDFEVPGAPMIVTGARPRVAILREQGVNGQREMARAFMAAGFEAVDVHMSDLEHERIALGEFHGLAACGGFSFGDVLGAGQGWARSILFNDRLREEFSGFFADSGRFALGVCNGCQMLSALREIIPGAGRWPEFVDNRSRQFEARLSLVGIEKSPSIFLAGMEGARLPVVTSHGEGRADLAGDAAGVPVAIRYVAADGSPAVRYPDNPNGSPGGLTGVCNDDGRVLAMMPHPERLLRAVNYSWAPSHWGETSPWIRMFHNARAWLE